MMKGTMGSTRLIFLPLERSAFMKMFGLECWLMRCTSFDWFCFWIILAIKMSSSEEGDPATTSIYSHFDFTSNLTAVFCDDGKCGCRGQLWRWEGNWWYAVPSNHVFKCWFLILSTMTMWNFWTCQWKNIMAITLFQVCLTDITECAMLERPCVTPVGASLPQRRWFFETASQRALKWIKLVNSFCGFETCSVQSKYRHHHHRG